MDPLLDKITSERATLNAEMKALNERVSELHEKLSRLDQAEAALKGYSLSTFKFLKPAESESARAPVRGMTIKQMVIKALEDHPNGLIALDILSEINSRFGKSYVRTSLSPQLSRLGKAGKIHKSGKHWILGKPDIQEAPM